MTADAVHQIKSHLHPIHLALTRADLAALALGALAQAAERGWHPGFSAALTVMADALADVTGPATEALSECRELIERGDVQ